MSHKLDHSTVVDVMVADKKSESYSVLKVKLNKRATFLSKLICW